MQHWRSGLLLLPGSRCAAPCGSAAHRPCPCGLALLQALSHAPRLRSLAINCSPKVSDRGLLALTRCATLRHLSADRCPQLSGAALAVLQRRLPLLRVARPAGGRGLLAQQLEY